ncbi:hypothetical protein F5Y19DRAFT_469889 [Xylariaceae sp. FL1651]|nr:hypothetical protein F5Y19DRAFT_469889 [Xylariaceae sp. FL1651]
MNSVSLNRGSAQPSRYRWRGPPSNPRIPPAPSSKMHRAVIFLLISCWMCLGAAISLDHLPHSTETAAATATAAETLLIDTRIPVFIDGHWQIMSDDEHRELRRREAAPKESTPTTTEVEIDVSSITTEATTTTTVASPLPSPFDGALAANFSADDKCPEFLNDFLSNSTFKSCYPVSLLLQGSQSFFEAEKSPFMISVVLDAACKADVNMCTDYLNTLANQLIADNNCGKEYKLQNALVVQAYQGMKTYETVYKATCLKNADSNDSSYCFASAVTNATTASNAYLYYLPFNSTLPQSAVPACASCTSQTMEIYQAATSNRKAEISYTYVSAAEQINSICGDNFVNTTLAAAVDSGATVSLYTTSPTLLLLSFVFMAISHWIL